MGRWMVMVLALLAGCTTGTTNITAGDSSVFLPSGRISLDIAPEVSHPSVPHRGHALELGASGGRGDDRQELNAGQDPVIFGGRTFSAPVALQHELEFRFLEAAYRFRRFFGKSERFGIEVLGGLARAELDLTVSSPAQSAHEKMKSGGVVGGFGLLWKLRPATSLQSRLSLFASGDEDGVSNAQRVEVHLAQAIGRHASLRAGYADWKLDSDRDFDTTTRSPVRARFSGFALGLDLMF